MKRLKNLWPRVIAFDNLLLAWRKARRGKSRGRAALAFELDLEHELFALQQELADGTYRPGRYRLFTVYERKPRLIAAAPFRDRVVHHAVMNVIEPPIDRSFIADSYACRCDKGAHRAVDRYQRWARRYPYVLKLDVRRYFPSIDHELLKDKLRRRIADKRVLALLDTIIDHGPDVADATPLYFPGDDLLTPLERRRGIPIGNLTSQFFANLYLDGLDHWIKETLRVAAYWRYVDDSVLLHDDKAQLGEWRQAIAERLRAERLQLHPSKAEISRTRDGLNVLGYRVFPDRRRLINANGLRFRRRLRGWAKRFHEHGMSLADIRPRIHAWVGHARHADTRGLRRRILIEVSFRRGTGR